MFPSPHGTRLNLYVLTIQVVGCSFGHCSLGLDGLGIVDFEEPVHGSSGPVTMDLWAFPFIVRLIISCYLWLERNRNLKKGS